MSAFRMVVDIGTTANVGCSNTGVEDEGEYRPPAHNRAENDRAPDGYRRSLDLISSLTDGCVDPLLVGHSGTPGREAYLDRNRNPRPSCFF
jgi:hypothetical protein